MCENESITKQFAQFLTVTSTSSDIAEAQNCRTHGTYLFLPRRRGTLPFGRAASRARTRDEWRRNTPH